MPLWGRRDVLVSAAETVPMNGGQAQEVLTAFPGACLVTSQPRPRNYLAI